MSKALQAARAKSRVWFYAPQFYWFGIGALSPVMVNHDEYARRTLVLGWTITGRIIFALGECGDPECKALAEQDIESGILA